MPLKGELAGGDLVPVAARSVLCRSVLSGLHKFSLTFCGTGARSPVLSERSMTPRDGSILTSSCLAVVLHFVSSLAHKEGRHVYAFDSMSESWTGSLDAHRDGLWQPSKNPRRSILHPVPPLRSGSHVLG